MRIQINDFRGLVSADFHVAPMALIAGNNAAGKTSLCQALGAAVSGSSIPLAGLRKSDAGALVRSGAADGKVVVEGQAGTVTVRWPSCKVASEGSAPQGSTFAAGLQSIVGFSKSERPKMLAPYLDAEPQYTDLTSVLTDLPEDQLSRLWESIEINGWDLAHSQARDKGIEFKGRWAQVTGEKYGSKKGAGWLPDEWGDDLEGASEQSLQDTLAREREYLDAAIATQAVSDDYRQQLQDKVDSIDTGRQAVDDAQTRATDLRQQLTTAQEHRDGLPPADKGGGGVPCPHCGERISIKRTPGAILLEKPPGPISETEAKARGSAIAKADGTLSRLKGEVDQCERDLAEAKRLVADSENAAAELASLPEPTSDSPDVEAARERVRRAETRVRAYQQKREADRIHQSIETNQMIVDALAPEGVRAAKLRKALSTFGAKRLDPISDAAGWGQVALDEDLMPTYRGRPFALLSESEQYRCRVALQVAMAQIDGSEIVIVDGADVLDRGGRNGLMKMLAGTGLAAVIAMTESGPDRVPDLSARGRGITLWIDAGTARPVTEPASRAA
ncbi:hypothetical protein [Fodinicurvata sp. EGI_FJ10296]|uniref:hypothetical protein n=1 Tax=Fodinicurvata sp. EGI_FJ10296 TaxID=3231908 RepID=UPI003456254D